MPLKDRLVRITELPARALAQQSWGQSLTKTLERIVRQKVSTHLGYRTVDVELGSEPCHHSYTRILTCFMRIGSLFFARFGLPASSWYPDRRSALHRRCIPG